MGGYTNTTIRDASGNIIGYQPVTESQPYNPAGVIGSGGANYDAQLAMANAQRYTTVGSGGTYPQSIPYVQTINPNAFGNDALGIAHQLVGTGLGRVGVVDPTIAAKIAQRGIILPSDMLPVDSQGKVVSGRSTVPINDLSSKMGTDYYGTPVPMTGDGMTYYKQGAGEVSVPGQTYLDTVSGRVTTNLSMAGIGGRNLNSPMTNLMGGTSEWGAGSVSVGKPNSSLVYPTNYAQFAEGNPLRYSPLSTGNYLDVEKNSQNYSRGGEAYYGWSGTPLDAAHKVNPSYADMVNPLLSMHSLNTPQTITPMYGSKEWYAKEIATRANPDSTMSFGSFGNQIGVGMFPKDSNILANYMNPGSENYKKGDPYFDSMGKSLQNVNMVNRGYTDTRTYGADRRTASGGYEVSPEPKFTLQRVITGGVLGEDGKITGTPSQKNPQGYWDASLQMLPNPKYVEPVKAGASTSTKTVATATATAGVTSGIIFNGELKLSKAPASKSAYEQANDFGTTAKGWTGGFIRSIGDIAGIDIIGGASAIVDKIPGARVISPGIDMVLSPGAQESTSGLTGKTYRYGEYSKWSEGAGKMMQGVVGITPEQMRTRSDQLKVESEQKWEKKDYGGSILNAVQTFSVSAGASVLENPGQLPTAAAQYYAGGAILGAYSKVATKVTSTGSQTGFLNRVGGFAIKRAPELIIGTSIAGELTRGEDTKSYGLSPGGTPYVMKQEQAGWFTSFSGARVVQNAGEMAPAIAAMGTAWYMGGGVGVNPFSKKAPVRIELPGDVPTGGNPPPGSPPDGGTRTPPWESTYTPPGRSPSGGGGTPSGGGGTPSGGFNWRKPFEPSVPRGAPEPAYTKNPITGQLEKTWTTADIAKADLKRGINSQTGKPLTQIEIVESNNIIKIENVMKKRSVENAKRAEIYDRTHRKSSAQEEADAIILNKNWGKENWGKEYGGKMFKPEVVKPKSTTSNPTGVLNMDFIKGMEEPITPYQKMKARGKARGAELRAEVYGGVKPKQPVGSDLQFVEQKPSTVKNIPGDVGFDLQFVEQKPSTVKNIPGDVGFWSTSQPISELTIISQLEQVTKYGGRGFFEHTDMFATSSTKPSLQWDVLRSVGKKYGYEVGNVIPVGTVKPGASPNTIGGGYEALVTKIQTSKTPPKSDMIPRAAFTGTGRIKLVPTGYVSYPGDPFIAGLDKGTSVTKTSGKGNNNIANYNPRGNMFDTFNPSAGGLTTFKKGNAGLDTFKKGNTGLDTFKKGNTGLDTFKKGNTGLDPFKKGNTGLDPFKKGNTGLDEWRKIPNEITKWKGNDGIVPRKGTGGIVPRGGTDKIVTFRKVPPPIKIPPRPREKGGDIIPWERKPIDPWKEDPHIPKITDPIPPEPIKPKDPIPPEPVKPIIPAIPIPGFGGGGGGSMGGGGSGSGGMSSHTEMIKISSSLDSHFLGRLFAPRRQAATPRQRAVPQSRQQRSPINLNSIMKPFTKSRGKKNKGGLW